MHTEGSNVCASLAADPEHAQVSIIVKFNELGLKDGSDTKLTLDGRDQRGALEQGASQCLEGLGELGLATRQLVVKADDGNVFLSCTLLGLDQAGGTVNAHNQTSCNLGIQSTAMASLLDTVHQVSKSVHGTINAVRQALHVPKDAFDPGDDLVTGGVRRLVEVDDAGADIRLDVTLQRGGAIGDGREMAGSHENCRERRKLVSSSWRVPGVVSAPMAKEKFRGQLPLTLLVVLEQKWPRACVNGRCVRLWLDGVLLLLSLGSLNDFHFRRWEGAMSQPIVFDR